MRPHHPTATRVACTAAAHARRQPGPSARHLVRAGYRNERTADADLNAPQQQPQQGGASHAAAAPTSRLTREELLRLASDFAAAWFGGIGAGPAAVQQQLMQLLEPTAVLVADGVRLAEDVEGLAGLLAEQERLHLEYHESEASVIMTAASPDSQRAYALVTVRYQDVGALPGHPATFRVSTVHHALALQAAPGGAGGRVERVWLRRQLTEEDKDELLVDPVHCYPAAFPKHLLRPLDTSGGGDPTLAARLAGAARAWWGTWDSRSGRAATTRHSGGAAPTAAGAAAPPVNKAPAAAMQLRLGRDFRILDAMGLYPAMRAEGQRAGGNGGGGGSSRRRYMTREAALRYRARLLRQFDVRMRVLDVGLAQAHLATFTHWQATFTPRSAASLPPGSEQQQQQHGTAAAAASASASASNASPASAAGPASGDSTEDGSSNGAAAAAAPAQRPWRRGRSFVVEGLEVDLFAAAPEAREAAAAAAAPELCAVWLFRSPLEAEAKLLLASAHNADLAAQAEQAAAAAHQARLAEREALLRDLLATMAAYQAQWESAMGHVRAAIGRQQERLQQVRGRLGGGGDEGGGGEGDGGEGGGNGGSSNGGGQAAGTPAGGDVEGPSEPGGRGPDRT